MNHTIYNFNFMGCMRETNNFSGHIELDILPDSFAVLGAKGYGGFTYLGGNIDVPVDESLIRQVNDSILDIQGEGVPLGGFTYYPRTNYRQSANIGYGDNVVDVRTGEEFQVTGWHDLSTINRNQFYHLKDRGFRPIPVSRSAFIALVNALDPFSGWTEYPDKVKAHRLFSLGEWTFYNESEGNRYFAVLKDKARSLRSNISAPFWDTIAILRGEVYSTYEDGSRIVYLLEEVETDEEYFHQRVFTEEVSYHYNNRLISLGLSGKLPD